MFTLHYNAFFASMLFRRNFLLFWSLQFHITWQYAMYMHGLLLVSLLYTSYTGIGWTSWKKRWFILTETSLVFYRSDPVSCICLLGMSSFWFPFLFFDFFIYDTVLCFFMYSFINLSFAFSCMVFSPTTWKQPESLCWNSLLTWYTSWKGYFLII